ncbi:MAG: hypothetical protein WCH43_06750 [Verrucomicrobiota bacterium]
MKYLSPLILIAVMSAVAYSAPAPTGNNLIPNGDFHEATTVIDYLLDGVDINGDGVFDLITGKTNGRIAVALNKGTKEQPKFDTPAELKGVNAITENKGDEAKRVFIQLFSQGMYSSALDDDKLANFFVEMGRVISKKTGVLQCCKIL